VAFRSEKATLSWFFNGIFNRTAEDQNVPRLYVYFACFAKYSYSFVSTISIVETILDLFSPSLAGISSVPIAILLTFRSFKNRFLVISAASTAVVIACPLAFKVISLALFADRPVIIART
jgi:hypothetical protein